MFVLPELWGRRYDASGRYTTYGTWHLEDAPLSRSGQRGSACHRVFETWQTTTDRRQVCEREPAPWRNAARERVCKTCLRIARARYGPDRS